MIIDDIIYGCADVSDRLVKIMRHPAMERIKKVHQNGAIFLVNDSIQTSRFEHSVGVMLLLNKLGAPFEEQVAGLLHDISHLAFSHVADHVFNQRCEGYHDKIYDAVFKDSGIASLLEGMGLDIKRLLDKRNFPLLEQNLPLLCADRIDYCLRDLFKENLITKEEIDEVLRSLMVHNNIIVCKNTDAGLKLARMFMKLNRNVFFKPEYEGPNLFLTEILKRALERSIITEDDFKKTDEDVLEKIRKSELSTMLDKLGKGGFVTPSESGKYEITRVLRIVDPYIGDTGKKLSELDADFKKELKIFKEQTGLKQRYDFMGAFQ